MAIFKNKGVINIYVDSANNDIESKTIIWHKLTISVFASDKNEKAQMLYEALEADFFKKGDTIEVITKFNNYQRGNRIGLIGKQMKIFTLGKNNFDFENVVL